MKRHIALISCRDEKGLIHKVMSVLLGANLNVVENSEFVDRLSSMFFMRTEFEGEFEGGIDIEGARQELARALPSDARIEIKSESEKRLVVFASDEPHCLGEVLMRSALGLLKGRILAVVSQHENCRELTERFDLPFHCVPTQGLSRREHELKVLEVVRPLAPDLLVLARYMRILTPEFVAEFPQSILNIHHSFLPAFIGRNPYEQAFERGVKIIGATAHFVNDDLDEGPIVTQGVIPVDHSHGPADMAKLGQDVEKMVLARALDLVLNDRVIVHGRKTIVFN